MFSDKDVLLTCQGRQSLISPASVEVKESGAIILHDSKSDVTTYIPAAVGCVVTELPLNPLPHQEAVVEAPDTEV